MCTGKTNWHQITKGLREQDQTYILTKVDIPSTSLNVHQRHHNHKLVLGAVPIPLDPRNKDDHQTYDYGIFVTQQIKESETTDEIPSPDAMAPDPVVLPNGTHDNEKYSRQTESKKICNELRAALTAIDKKADAQLAKIQGQTRAHNNSENPSVLMNVENKKVK